jgi:hypothetical protein
VAMQQLDDLLELRFDTGTVFLPVGHLRFRSGVLTGRTNLRPHSR